MSKIGNRRENLKSRKLSLNRETVRSLSAETLQEVAGGVDTRGNVATNWNVAQTR